MKNSILKFASVLSAVLPWIIWACDTKPRADYQSSINQARSSSTDDTTIINLSNGITDSQMRNYVGHRITIVAFCQGPAKLGVYLKGKPDTLATAFYVIDDSEQDVPDVDSICYGDHEPTIEATGLLHFFDPPVDAQTQDRNAQPAARPPRHFYLKTSESTFRVLSDS